MGIDHAQEWDVTFNCGTQDKWFAFALFQCRHQRGKAHPPAAQLKSHLILEPLVVMWDAGDDLNQFAAFGAPAVDLVELQADQPFVPVFGQGADQFRTPDPERDAVISPGLGNVIERRDYTSRGMFLDEGVIPFSEGGMRPLEQVARPPAEAIIGFFGAVFAVDAGIEFSQFFGIRRRGTAQYQAIAQLADDIRCNA